MINNAEDSITSSEWLWHISKDSQVYVRQKRIYLNGLVHKIERRCYNEAGASSKWTVLNKVGLFVSDSRTQYSIPSGRVSLYTHN